MKKLQNHLTISCSRFQQQHFFAFIKILLISKNFQIYLNILLYCASESEEFGLLKNYKRNTLQCQRPTYLRAGIKPCPGAAICSFRWEGEAALLLGLAVGGARLTGLGWARPDHATLRRLATRREHAPELRSARRPGTERVALQASGGLERSADFVGARAGWLVEAAAWDRAGLSVAWGAGCAAAAAAAVPRPFGRRPTPCPVGSASKPPPPRLFAQDTGTGVAPGCRGGGGTLGDRFALGCGLVECGHSGLHRGVGSRLWRRGGAIGTGRALGLGSIAPWSRPGAFLCIVSFPFWLGPGC